MPLPQTPFTLHGGCNCRAIRYTITVPPHSSRPQNPYKTPHADIGDARIPMVVIDHCNDCRQATGALLPIAIVTDLATVSATCTLRSAPSSTLTLPASSLFNATTPTPSHTDTHLRFHKSSPQRSRWFCDRCGTPLAYTIDDAAIPPAWGGLKMLDLWLGTIDREDLDDARMRPERQLWCAKGIGWIRDFARRGGDGVPMHPTTKLDELVPQARGIADVLAEARTHLERVTPAEAWAEGQRQVDGEPVVLVDIRPAAQREAEGEIEGAVVVERNVLEWRFDPQSDARLPVAGRYDLRVIVFCQEGYTSSLAARSLQEVGLVNVTDMAGGYRAWREAGLPRCVESLDVKL